MNLDGTGNLKICKIEILWSREDCSCTPLPLGNSSRGCMEERVNDWDNAWILGHGTLMILVNSCFLLH